MNRNTGHHSPAWQAQQIAAERAKLRQRAEGYYLPLIEEMRCTLSPCAPFRLLSVGCGIGEDVDVYLEHGLDAWGVDPGFRSAAWHERRARRERRLIRGDGCLLPFATSSFDAVLSSGVIEHIGAQGDGLELRPDYQEHRRRFARELVRVTRPGGTILLDAPNKRCPADPWHGPFRLGARWHPPWERFLVDAREIRSLFVGSAGARSVELLPLTNFFLFANARQRPGGRLIEGAARTFFRLTAHPGLAWLRASFLAPYLVARIRC